MTSPTRILITDFVWPSAAPDREALVAGLGDGRGTIFQGGLC